MLIQLIYFHAEFSVKIKEIIIRDDSTIWERSFVEDKSVPLNFVFA